MNMWDVINESPVLSAVVIVLIGYQITECVRLCWNRMLRTINLCNIGWPPPHCDADGDFRPAPEKADDETENNEVTDPKGLGFRAAKGSGTPL